MKTISNLRMCHLLNFKKIKKKKRLIITHATNKVIINLKLTKCNNLFTKLIKENTKRKRKYFFSITVLTIPTFEFEL